MIGRSGRLLTAMVLAVLSGCGDERRANDIWPRTSDRETNAFAERSDSPASDRKESQPVELGEKSTLEDYLAYAALKSPALEAAFYRWQAAVDREPQARALSNPKFTYKYFIEQVETRVGAQQQAFGVAQTFPWPGKLSLAGDAAAKEAQAERLRYEAAKLDLFRRVKKAYYEYYYLGRAIGITEENVRLLQHIESVARTRYKAAAESHMAVIRTQVELGKLEDRLKALKDMRGPVLADLNASLNRAPGETLPLPTSVMQEKIDATDDQLLKWMAEANPQLQARSHEIAARRHRIDLARKQYYPDVTAGLTVIDTADSTGGRRPDGDGQDPVIASVSISLPVWWNKYAAGVREARSRYRSAVRGRADQANRLNVQLKMAVFRFRDAGRRIALYGETLLAKARESLKATETAFRGGRASYLDFIDAQRILLEFQLSYERALADHGKTLADLDALVGRTIPRAGR